MKVQELLDILKQAPGSAKIYREADHGQNPEASPSVWITHDKELPYYGEDIQWIEYGPRRSIHSATAILIG